MADPLAIGLAARDARRLRDPLEHFDWPSEKHRRVAECFAARIDTHHRAGNKGAKTWSWAAVFVALARRKRYLAGVRLPYFDTPPDLAVLVPSYKQAVDSSNKALLHWIGDWPHEIGWVSRALGYIGMIRVMPDGGNPADSSTWSKILFVSQDERNPRSIWGQRWHAVAGDEPPQQDYWREARKNAPYRIIAETPLDITEWEWIRDDYFDALDDPKDGRVEIVSSLYDNKFLTDDEKRELIESYKNDQYLQARITGAYLDLRGDSPWGPDGYVALQRRAARCRRGRALPITIPDHDVPMVCQQWFRPEPGEEYILSADLSEGISDGKHDPSRIDILARRKALHVLSWAGFEDAYFVGLLSCHLAEAFNGAWVDFDATGGWGSGFMRGTSDFTSRENPSGYRRLVRTDDATEPGKLAQRFGYKATDGLRGEVVSAVREWASLSDEKADDVFRTWDSTLIDDLLAVRLVRTQSGGLKAMSKGKDHDEAMFTLGRLLILNKTLRWAPVVADSLRGPREVLRDHLGVDLLPRVSQNGHGVVDSFGNGG